jgi:hypothetical protein
MRSLPSGTRATTTPSRSSKPPRCSSPPEQAGAGHYERFGAGQAHFAGDRPTATTSRWHRAPSAVAGRGFHPRRPPSGDDHGNAGTYRPGRTSSQRGKGATDASAGDHRVWAAGDPHERAASAHVAAAFQVIACRRQTRAVLRRSRPSSTQRLRARSAAYDARPTLVPLFRGSRQQMTDIASLDLAAAGYEQICRGFLG